MALSGAGLFLFVVGHLVGNLQFFLEPAAINRYGHFLKSTPELLWPARIGLLTLIALHVLSAIRLSAENKAARPQAYGAGVAPKDASLASRTMLMSGLVIAAFILYHLLHFTVQVPEVNFAGTDFDQLYEPNSGGADVFAMIVCGFSVWYVSLFYLVAVGLLCVHLGHGVAAMFQSLGLRNHTWAPRIAIAARVAAVLIFLGYASIPVSVLLGRGREYARRIQAGVAPDKAGSGIKAVKGVQK